MYLWDGKVYKDDRLFILDLTPAKKDNQAVWTLVTRRNYEGFPPFRSDEFETKEKAIEYIKKVEPATPLISLSGKQPKSPLPYDKYCEKLHKENLPTALDIYKLNKQNKREIIIETVREEDIL